MTPKAKKTSVLTAAPSIQNGFSLISNEKLLQLYATMLKCRAIHECLRILIKKNKLALNLAASRGQEAASVGLTIDLLPEDTIAPHPGDIIPFFISGLPLQDLLPSSFGPTSPAPSIAGRLKTATDAARLNKLSNNKRIAVAISNESTSTGSWQKALTFAGLHDLPMIFLSCNHIPSKTKRRPLPAITVDGNDVVAVYRVACEAIAHARLGNGPTLIECQPYVLNPGDPILNMEQYLTRKGILSTDFKCEIVAEFRNELDAAIGQISRPERLGLPLELLGR
jgi:TPP-dependent pyruvate/acetoin dehydrogenase alpha subunit